MGISEREYHIKVLENLLSHYKAREPCEGYYDSTLKDNVEALEYAISSIKTDEAYQIMYEGGEIFTKADIVAVLEDLDLQIDESAAYNLEVAKVQRLIRDKIDKLKESRE
jgi:hypothetical protein